MWIKSLEFHLANFFSIYNEVVGSLGLGCLCGPEEKVTGAGGLRSVVERTETRLLTGLQLISENNYWVRPRVCYDPGGVLLGIFGGVCRPHLQIQTQFQTKKFSNTRFQA